MAASAMAGFSFGATSTTTAASASPFSFGATAKTTAPALNLSNPATGTGFNFSLTTKTTASTGLLATPASTTTPALGFGATPATCTASSTGFSLGAPAASTGGLGGFNFGAKPATTTTASTGFGLLGSAPSTASSGLGSGLSLGAGTGLGAGSTFGGGLFGSTTSTATATTTGSIFSTQPTTTASVGLGGVDPTKAVVSGSSSTSASDGKTLKESLCPEQLTATVDSLQKYVKEEKAVREEIARMSSKPMMKVQEDVTALRQLLSVVANGLQQNTCSVDKLKQEMTRNLKNAEMAQRTKDIPAGLQYENTAPTEYFQRLVDEFEERMMMYRQQIETLDNHLAALHQPSPHTPSEVLSLMKKLHETFLSLAAQLQQVHEAVKSQKDQFLTYRRVFHGDTKNIFQKPAPVARPVKNTQLSDLAGPNPFPGTTNAAAQAMAMVHSRAQQPQGPPITGLVGAAQPGTSLFFGGAKQAQGFGTPSLGGTSSIGAAGNLFSSTAIGGSAAAGGFGTPPTLGSSTTAALNLAGTNLNMSANTKQPFMLQKPPQGAKRGKR